MDTQVLSMIRFETMRPVIVLFLIVSLGALARAQDDPRRAQVHAAQASAVSTLHDQIARAPITANLTVRDFLDRTHGHDELTRALQRAEQIGGPRWIGSGTCQVHLAISGKRVASALAQIAAANPKSSPISPDELAKQLAAWDEQTFSATGTSAGSAVVTQLRPAADSWSSIAPERRRQAVESAIQSAANRVLDSIQPVALTNDLTLADLLKRPEISKELHDWLVTRPVTKVDFRNDLQVEVALAVPPTDLSDRLREAVLSDKELPADARQADWPRIAQDVARRMAPAVGRARAARPELAEPPTAKAIELPDELPAWVNQQLGAEGTATPAGGAGSRLKTARRAEEKAIRELRARVDALPLTPKLTVGDAAKGDANLSERIGWVTTLAQTDKVQYHEDGSVTVRVSLDLRELWQALFAQGS